ncbi:hypothetical protein BDQ17DRAFT_1349807 [Cyathus striatus]|nr:hypothetical protein BDQ17DRAFT_1349807 [Cyathus striatus]
MSKPSALHAAYTSHDIRATSTSWRPKITGYRLLLVLLTLWISTAKLFLSFRAGSDMAITTLEFVLYPMLPILWYTVEKYHARLKPAMLQKFFQLDFSGYGTSDNTRKQHNLVTDDLVLIRDYDILFTIFSLSYAIIKTALLCFGFTTAASIFDYLGTLCIGIGLYCVGP